MCKYFEYFNYFEYFKYLIRSIYVSLQMAKNNEKADEHVNENKPSGSVRVFLISSNIN